MPDLNVIVKAAAGEIADLYSENRYLYSTSEIIKQAIRTYHDEQVRALVEVATKMLAWAERPSVGMAQAQQFEDDIAETLVVLALYREKTGG